jgi:hypothetical protein
MGIGGGPIATPTSTSTSTDSITAPTQSTATLRIRRSSTFTSPWSAALLVLGLLGLAISGTIFAFRSAPTSAMGGPPAQSAGVIVHSAPAELTGLQVRGQPERWSSTEAKAVQEERQGDMNFNIRAYKSAMNW